MEKEDELKIMKQTDSLSEVEVKKLLYRMKNFMIVGTELETQNEDKNNRDKLIEKLNPTGNYYAIPDNLVVEVTTDGSLHTRGNAEVIMLGDNASFEELRDKYNLVESAFKELDYYVDEECGQHLSLLTQKPVRIPSIVFRNFFQLIKFYCPEFMYLTSAGINKGKNLDMPIVRHGANQYANWNFNNTTAIGKTSNQMISLSKQEAGRGIHSGREGGKYGFFNIYKTRLIPDTDDIGYLFVEFRVPDRQMFSSVTTSWNFLIRAMFLKAIKISEFGLLLGTNELWSIKKNHLDSMFNEPSKKIVNNKLLKENTHFFVDYLKEELLYLEGEKAYKILKFLCDYPLWKLRMNLKSDSIDKAVYDKISDKKDSPENMVIEDFEKYIRMNITMDYEVEKKTGTLECIQENLVIGVLAKDEEEMINILSVKAKVSDKTIKSYLENMKIKKINNKFVGD